MKQYYPAPNNTAGIESGMTKEPEYKGGYQSAMFQGQQPMGAKTTSPDYTK